MPSTERKKEAKDNVIKFIANQNSSILKICLKTKKAGIKYLFYFEILGKIIKRQKQHEKTKKFLDKMWMEIERENQISKAKSNVSI